MKRLSRTAISLLVLICATSAHAQSNQGFSIQNFQSTPGHNPYLTLEGARLPRGFSLNVGGMLHYAYRPLMVRACNTVTDGRCTDWSDQDAALIAHQITLELFGAVSLFGIGEIGLVLPVVVYQTGEGADQVSGAEAVSSPGGKAGLEDIRLHLKLDLLRGIGGYEKDDFGLALVTVVSFPVGNAVQEDSFMGNSSVTVHPKLAFTAVLNRVRLGLNAGYLWRKETNFLLSEVGPRISYGAGAEVTFTDAWSGLLEVFGQSGFTKYPTSLPLEADLAARRRFDNGLSLTGGLGAGVLAGIGTPMIRVFLGAAFSPWIDRDKDGDGILDKDDACPTQPEDKDGFEDTDGCPDPDNDKDGVPDADDKCPNNPEDKDGFEDEDGCVDPDNDGDGIPDVKDACPDAPEDKDGFEDSDGCPDKDNDKDGVLDEADKCPLEKEDADGFEDSDGCPDKDNDGDRIPDDRDKCPNEKEILNGFEDSDGCPDEGKALVELKDATIDLNQKVHFKNNSDKIVKKESFALLDVVVGILTDNPTMTVRIEGHTDSKGNREHNLDLSQRRADSVRKYLTDKGIDAKRLDAKGFGPDKPVDTNDTKAGQAANRRVEFHITHD